MRLALIASCLHLETVRMLWASLQGSFPRNINLGGDTPRTGSTFKVAQI